MKIVAEKEKVRSFYLKKDEKIFLFYKHMKKKGRDEANKIVGDCCKYLSVGVEKLRKQKKSEEEIGVWFREEFMKMRESY